MGVVRGATNRFLGLYDQVKRASPLLQFGLEKVEQIPWKLADPMIDGLDTRIDDITYSVTSKVTAIQHKYQTSKAVVAAGAVKTTEKWKDLRGDLTKKAGLRIDQGLNRVREFTPARGKEIVYVDLIQYSRDIIDGASDAVTRKLKPMYDPVARNLSISVRKASQAASHLRHSLADVTDPTNLRLRLKQARRAVRNLSNNGIAYAQAKYGDLASRIPDSSTLHKSLEVIASAPNYLKNIKDKADLDASKSILENLKALILAIRVVVFQGQEEGVIEDVAHHDLPSQDEQVFGLYISAKDDQIADLGGEEGAVDDDENQPEKEVPSQDELASDEEEGDSQEE